jgi:uncharacterized protein (DUF2235 family)
MTIYIAIGGIAAALLGVGGEWVFPAWLGWTVEPARWFAVFLLTVLAARLIGGALTRWRDPIWALTGGLMAAAVTVGAAAALVVAVVAHAIDVWTGQSASAVKTEFATVVGAWHGVGAWVRSITLPTWLSAAYDCGLYWLAYLPTSPAFWGALLGFVWFFRNRTARRKLMREILIEPTASGEIVFETDTGPPALADTHPTGRRIAIFCDGTSNSPDMLDDGEPAATNVHKLYWALLKDERQHGWYDPGVGTDTSSDSVDAQRAQSAFERIGLRRAAKTLGGWRRIRMVIEAATGLGITENIVQAYAEIVKRYRPGDALYLIGFSRGAYTARCVAGVIARCGLLRPENVGLAAEVVALYKTRRASERNVPIAKSLIHARTPRIEMLGVFDTVGSLGVPMWGWWFNLRQLRSKALSTSPVAICENVYHVVAMDERRAQFFPTLFDKPDPHKDAAAQRLHQVWFRGAHADVGGGYARRGLSDITLDWMLRAARTHGLRFDPKKIAALRIEPDPLEIPHDEMERQLAWKAGGSWPRWHPIPGSAPIVDFGPVPDGIHKSVVTRAAAMNALGRFDLKSPGHGDPPISFSVGASRQWNATGLALETGATYCVRAEKGFVWRDATCPPCGPEGQDLSAEDFIRFLASRSKRLPDERYMTLCITVAHPREWGLREFGIDRLLRYLFFRDPAELRAQVAPIGRDMADGKPVYIKIEAAGGMLYTFANDLWITDANNYGALKLSLERVPYPAYDAPIWTLGANGNWVWPDGRERTPDSLDDRRSPDPARI